MIKTTRIFAAMVLVAIATSVVNAQEKLERLMEDTTPEERAELQTSNMAETLSLTEEEKQKVYAVNLKYAHLMQKAYNSDQGRLQRFREMKDVRDKKDSELKKVLTPAQYAAYIKNKQDMKETMREKSKNKNR